MENRLGVLYIKKRTLPEWLAYFIFVMPFMLSFLTDFLGIPDFLKYFIDAVWLIAFSLLIMNRRISLSRNLIPIVILLVAFLGYTLINYAFNYQSILYYLWGFRNNFRFYIAFIIFSLCFESDDLDKCLKFMDVVFWINAVVTFFQFFVLGYQQDYLGGIFGVDRGCNASSIVFFSIVISKSIINFMSNKENFLLCFLKVAVVLIISAMAELKFFFLVFVIIVLMATFMTSFAWRKVLVLLVSALLFFFASTILTDIFGEGSNLSLEKIFELATSENYASKNDIGRLTGIGTIARNIFSDVTDSFFGLGLGNCDTSNVDIFNTPFYQSYGYMHYSWFSAVFMFLELGYVGLLFYVLFFVFCFVFALKQKKKSANPLYCQLTMIMSVLCLVIMFYNSSLRTEVGYMVYFVFAMPFISALNNDNTSVKSV